MKYTITNFICQLGRSQYLDTWSDIVLNVALKIFLDETDIYIARL